MSVLQASIGMDIQNTVNQINSEKNFIRGSSPNRSFSVVPDILFPGSPDIFSYLNISNFHDSTIDEENRRRLL
jgi:hypothetical protein